MMHRYFPRSNTELIALILATACSSAAITAGTILYLFNI